MPKKKKGQKEEEVIVRIGRPGNNVKMGIVGLPNVGKSSLYNVLSGQQAEVGNRAFCTIDPNKAKVIVPDKRFTWLCDHYKTKSKIPASLTILDIAGLVKNASEGAGLGNDFLANIDSVDGIYHVVRAFRGKHIEHVEGDVDPVRDLEIISNELLKKDIKTISRIHKEKEKMANVSRDKHVKAEFEIATKVLEILKSGKDIRSIKKWSVPETHFLNEALLLTSKPMVYLVNVSMKNWEKGQNKWLEPITKWIEKRDPGAKMIPFCCKFEYEAHESKNPEEYVKKSGRPSMIKKIIHSGYKALRMFHYFTASEKEVRCWSICKGWNARKAAGVIHTDFEKHFINAEVMKFKDLKEYGGEQQVRAHGKRLTKGANYICEDGDIYHFQINQGAVGQDKKKKKK